jgi:hypothetical protein
MDGVGVFGSKKLDVSVKPVKQDEQLKAVGPTHSRQNLWHLTQS